MAVSRSLSWRSIFDEPPIVCQCDKILCQVFDITSQTKRIYTEKIKDAIISSFSSDFKFHLHFLL